MRVRALTVCIRRVDVVVFWLAVMDMENVIEAPATSVATTAAPPRNRWTLILLIVLWIGATVAGLAVLAHYAGTPGSPGDPPARWPSDTTLQLNPHGATLVMFVHPHCPCSRASLSELERMLSHCTGSVTPLIEFCKPDGMPAEWEQSDLWRTAEAIPSVHVNSDPNGVEANRFHAFTSGQTLLYDAQGKLLFSGGITGARGHEGDNAGETSLQEFVNQGNSNCPQTPVFGCPLGNHCPLP
jgi:hypothetical protein